MTDYPQKLIEVALPLDAINAVLAAATREKSIRHGHPSTLSGGLCGRWQSGTGGAFCPAGHGQ